MSHHTGTILLGLCLLGIAMVIQGQPADAAFRNLTSAEGLPNTSVADVTQDAHGLIWIATWDGVYRFDGNKYTRITGKDCRKLASDDKGGVWMSFTSSGTLGYYDTQTDQINWYAVGKDNRSPNIAIDGSGQVWAGLNNGIVRLDPIVDTFLLDGAPLPNGVFFLEARGEGHLSFMTRDSISREFVIGWRDPEGNYRFEPLPTDRNNPEPGKSFNENFPPFGMIAVGETGLMIINEFGWAVKQNDRDPWIFRKPGNADSIANFRATAFDPEGNLWLNQADGIVRIDTASGTMTVYTNDPENPNSILPLKSLGMGNSIFIDRQGIMWVTRYGSGISTMNLYAGDFGLVKDIKGNTLPDVLSAVELQDHSYFIGARINKNSLYHFDADGQIIRLYGSSSFRAPEGRTVSKELSHPFVWALATTADGSIWAGTGWPRQGDGGLNRIRPGQSEITRFKHNPEDTNSIPDDWVMQLLVDKSERLWIHSVRKGWCWMDIESETIHRGFDRKSLGLADDTGWGNHGFINKEGNLVIGFKHQYYEVDHSTLEVSPFARLKDSTMKIYLILHDDLGRLWFTHKNGFGFLNAPYEEITYYYDITQGNFPADEVSTLNLDDQGQVWLATSNGIIRFDVNGEQWIHFGYERGLQDNYFSGRTNLKGPSGKIYFSGTAGANIIDPARIRTNPYPPDMVFTRLKLDDTPIFPGPDNPLEQPIEVASNITVGPEVSVISIDFAAIHFAGSRASRFQYMLEGFDRDWRDGGSVGNATYTSLPHGNYSLRIRGANLDGVWSDGNDSLEIRILPPWYKTWWAYLTYAVLFILTLVLFDRYQRRRLVTREREKTREKELAQAREIKKAYTELKATQKQLVHAEKMASLGELTAGIAHEIQNPLNFVNNFSDVNGELLDELSEEIEKGNPDEIKAIIQDLKDNEEKIKHHGKRADSIVKGMLQHSRSSNGQKKPTDLNALADEYLRLAYHGLRAKDKSFNAEFRLEADDQLPKVNAVPQDIGRVLLNLINNAFYAVDRKAKEGGDGYKPTVVVSTRHTNEKVEIRVKDNGNGIPNKLMDKIFQPFFTTKPTGEGTGLGLSLSYDIVTKGHGGSIEVHSKEGEGTTFLILLANQTQSTDTVKSNKKTEKQ